MTIAAELYADAQRLREIARAVTDANALFEIQKLIDELERRARELGNGNGRMDHTFHEFRRQNEGFWGERTRSRLRLAQMTIQQLETRTEEFRAVVIRARSVQSLEALKRLVTRMEGLTERRRTAETETTQRWLH